MNNNDLRKILLLDGNAPPPPPPPWSPTDPGGVALWLDTEMGITKDGSDRVGQHADQSGNLAHFNQATDAKKPVWTPNQFDTHPGIVLDSVDDYLRCTNLTQLSTFHFFMILRVPVAGWHFAFGVYDPEFSIKIQIDPALSGIAIYDEGAVNFYVDFDPVANTPYLMEIWRDSGNQYYVALNGVEATENPKTQAYATTSPNAAIGLQDATNELYPGDSEQTYASVLIYNAVLSSANKTLVRNYYKNRYPCLGM